MARDLRRRRGLREDRRHVPGLRLRHHGELQRPAKTGAPSLCRGGRVRRVGTSGDLRAVATSRHEPGLRDSNSGRGEKASGASRSARKGRRVGERVGETRREAGRNRRRARRGQYSKRRLRARLDAVLGGAHVGQGMEHGAGPPAVARGGLGRPTAKCRGCDVARSRRQRRRGERGG